MLAWWFPFLSCQFDHCVLSHKFVKMLRQKAQSWHWTVSARHLLPVRVCPHLDSPRPLVPTSWASLGLSLEIKSLRTFTIFTTKVLSEVRCCKVEDYGYFSKHETLCVSFMLHPYFLVFKNTYIKFHFTVYLYGNVWMVKEYAEVCLCGYWIVDKCFCGCVLLLANDQPSSPMEASTSCKLTF